MPTQDSADQEAIERRTLTVRLTLPQWKRIKSFAVELDATIQDLLVAGLSRLLTERGLEPVDPDVLLLPPPKKRRPKGDA